MRRQVNYPALAWLIVVLLGTAVALRLAWQSFLANPQLLQAGRPLGWASTFGLVATLIIVVAAPLVAWLVPSAFFSFFRRYIHRVVASLVGQRPNSSSTPNPLRSPTHMAAKACHVVAWLGRATCRERVCHYRYTPEP